MGLSHQFLSQALILEVYLFCVFPAACREFPVLNRRGQRLQQRDQGERRAGVAPGTLGYCWGTEKLAGLVKDSFAKLSCTGKAYLLIPSQHLQVLLKQEGVDMLPRVW